MIDAKIITDSIANGIRITTMELCYPRFIHSEMMTHRMFSRNAASTRAIPTNKFIELCTAMPIHWGKNIPGMQAREEIENIEDAKIWWSEVNDCITENVKFAINKYNLHKQVVNRLLEPFQWISVIVTSTEWDNFFHLRNHCDAQPEIRMLAKHIQRALDDSVPNKLEYGEWHLPYITKNEFIILDNYGILIKCSVARCARVSYLNHDASYPNVEKDILLADKLLQAGHMSPMEHVCTPMKYISSKPISATFDWEKGITHMDRNYNFWSGNFRGFIQYRQLLQGD